MPPRLRLPADSRTDGVSPAWLASAHLLPKRVLSPTSARITIAEEAPMPGAQLQLIAARPPFNQAKINPEPLHRSVFTRSIRVKPFPPPEPPFMKQLVQKQLAQSIATMQAV